MTITPVQGSGTGNDTEMVQQQQTPVNASQPHSGHVHAAQAQAGHDEASQVQRGYTVINLSLRPLMICQK